MDLFDFISRYFWLICIGTALINYLWLAWKMDVPMPP